MKIKKLTLGQQKSASVHIKKALILFQKGEFPRALELYKKLYQLTKDPRALQLQSVCQYRLKRFEDAIRLAELALKAFHNIGQQDIATLENLTEINGVFGNLKESERYGKIVLQLKDEFTMTSFNKTNHLNVSEGFEETVLNGTKKIISFSLYGGLPRYCENAILNVEAAKLLLPDFICRFYIDDSVPGHVVTRLKDEGAEVITVDEESMSLPGTMWRFLVFDDPEVSLALCRDCDSIVSIREKPLVDEWLASKLNAHVIRDFHSHCELMLAGLFSIKAGVVSHVKQAMLGYVAKQKVNFHTDQIFLRQFFWPLIKPSLLTHDRCFQYGEFLGKSKLGEPVSSVDHIGANMGALAYNIKVDAKDNSIAVWHFVNSDGVRFAEYQSITKNKSFSASIPHDYGIKIQQGAMKLEWSIVLD
ncbi:hypothetical protein MUS1_10320 [Marinomonas ushuaiensis DSM 15871]|uniref:Uncharacterized protein n=1 Tax=Marinomonas ushuaiensis DSM 15871 TaxID=1122207 RepID=X7E2H4_9GAMM|nr:tetratricopeptide repeat protein [Marinomonas ushuaiensis]ETX09368.1 hypothetical protein MUS1_10320 [Marinomonas ushuaiensis DSM 15871]